MASKNSVAGAKSKTSKRYLDFLFIVGLLLGVAMIIGSIMYVAPSKDGMTPGHIDPILALDFFDLPSVLIVIGGTFAALMVSFPMSYFKNIGKHLKLILLPTIYDPKATIEKLVEYATSARIEGILSLENKLNDVEDHFLKTSLMLVVDSIDPEEVEKLLDTELDYLEERHAQTRRFYEKGAIYAPAFGMIGTLIGLVKMLADLGELGSDGLGPAMSVALITTFYGTVLANLFFAPIANKLRVRHEEETLCKMIIVEGVEAIQAGENPRYIEEKLLMLLPDSLKDEPKEKRSNKKKR